MKKLNKICLIIIIILLFAILINFSVNAIKKQHRMKELLEDGYYHLYTTYVNPRDQYHVFVMINTPTKDFEELELWAKRIITEEFISTLKNSNIFQDHGASPAEIYLVSSSDELAFGWEKNELNIEMNFDQSVFYRNSHIVVSIPLSAISFSDCTVKSK